METRKIEHVTYTEVYVAIDGQEFTDSEECAKYESSAFGVLIGRLKKISVRVSSECDLFGGAGSDENMSYVVIPQSEDDVRVIQQLVYLKTFGKDWKKKFAERVEVGKVLVVTVGYDNEGVWVTDLGDIVKDATEGKYGIAEVK